MREVLVRHLAEPAKSRRIRFDRQAGFPAGAVESEFWIETLGSATFILLLTHGSVGQSGTGSSLAPGGSPSENLRMN